MKALLSAGIRLGNLGARQLTTHGALFTPAARQSAAMTSDSSKLGRMPRGFGHVNAYALFLKENRKPKESIGENASRIASMWKSLGQSEKDVSLFFYILMQYCVL